MTDMEAREELELFLNWTSFPSLSVAEIDALVRKARRKDVNLVPPDPYFPWSANKAYSLGDIVIPDPRNGFYYTCTVAGTSDDDQPTFPETDGDTVVDSEITWENTGVTTWVPTWNLPYSLCKGWKLKAAKVVTAVDIKQGDQSITRSQIFEMCMKMADTWGKIAGKGSSIRLAGSLRTQLSIFPITNASTDVDLAQAIYGVEILDLSGWAIPGRTHWQDY